MSIDSASSPARRAQRSGYVVAVLATGGALAVRLLLESILVEKAPMLLFTLSVMVSGWWGGLRPGLLATALGMAAAMFFLLSPRLSFAVEDARDLTQVAIFLVIGGSISMLCERLHDQRSKISVLQELGRLSDELRRTVEHVKSFAIFMTDPDGRATSWNNGVKEIFGYDEQEFAGKPVIPLIFTAEDVREGRAQAEFERARMEGRALDDRWMTRKDGTQFFASGVTTAVHDPAGRLAGFVKILRDQTEPRRLQEAMESSERRLRQLVDANIVGVAFSDRHGRFLDSNDEFLRIVGYDREDLRAGRSTGSR
jgi:PAS domain S-box-containing protein